MTGGGEEQSERKHQQRVVGTFRQRKPYVVRNSGNKVLLPVSNNIATVGPGPKTGYFHIKMMEFTLDEVVIVTRWGQANIELRVRGE